MKSVITHNLGQEKVGLDTMQFIAKKIGGEVIHFGGGYMIIGDASAQLNYDRLVKQTQEKNTIRL